VNSSDYAAWIYVLAGAWVAVSLTLTVQMCRLRNEEWPSLGWKWGRGREPGCFLTPVLIALYFLAFWAFILSLFLSAFAYFVVASLFGDLNEIGMTVVTLTGGVAGFFAISAIFSFLVD
jgi:hypothetical protein